MDAMLRQIIDINPHFIFVKDREGQFTLVNKAVADAYGTTVEDLLGKTDADFNPNVEEVEFFLKMDREVIDNLEEKFIPEEAITDSTGTVTYEQGSESAPAIFATSAEIVTAGFRPTTYGIIDDNPTWWVDTGLEGRQRTDIKLYSRHYGENTAVPFIECASCHDPHSETSTFLRVDNAGSGLCLSCHDI